MAESRFTTNAGVRLHFLDSGGDDRGAPIVFVPGFTCIAEDYVEVLPVFGRRTVVVELRGHGRSDAPESGYDSATFAGDVGAVVDAVTAGPVHVVTFSRGTPYALIWALAHRERVHSLSIGDYVPEEITLPDGVSASLLDGRWRGTPVRDRLDRRAGEAIIASARRQSFWQALSDWQPPLLAVRSPTGPLISDTAWDRYRAEFPTASLHVFDESPHDIFRPDRERYPKLVRAHVDAAGNSVSPVRRRP
ncbi:alpha/beta fold hydrolase [Mycolicibacterium flavescens]|uniref:Alpha/beta hydrolase n=1 Tax=Mycolicibacterium flavescens TaxID=1776 RepID=A0A1E3RDP3_MYCFV|nr:alpha/beta fold hydrolase [Mycolicibacterium flavescens]MCV7282335.1 alpha/beta fold hydrolase [Mycolicibacterium flavescens]ODQ87959.1 alpha/beta hydrolase [Mycolicibacterium flavescens]